MHHAMGYMVLIRTSLCAPGQREPATEQDLSIINNMTINKRGVSQRTLGISFRRLSTQSSRLLFGCPSAWSVVQERRGSYASHSVRWRRRRGLLRRRRQHDGTSAGRGTAQEAWPVGATALHAGSRRPWHQFAQLEALAAQDAALALLLHQLATRRWEKHRWQRIGSDWLVSRSHRGCSGRSRCQCILALQGWAAYPGNSALLASRPGLVGASLLPAEHLPSEAETAFAGVLAGHAGPMAEQLRPQLAASLGRRGRLTTPFGGYPGSRADGCRHKQQKHGHR